MLLWNKFIHIKIYWNLVIYKNHLKHCVLHSWQWVPNLPLFYEDSTPYIASHLFSKLFSLTSSSFCTPDFFSTCSKDQHPIFSSSLVKVRALSRINTCVKCHEEILNSSQEIKNHVQNSLEKSQNGLHQRATPPYIFSSLVTVREL